ncbi:MAG: DUF1311 domain-containing protein [Roseburia sp.]|nr:DUF1311 domain-containing protein [Roseburia sp.]
MKKKWILLSLSCVMALSVSSCGSIGTEIDDSTANTESEFVTEQNQTEIQEESQAETSENPEETFSFAEFENLQFIFASGAGGWATMMTINPDGSFSGEYFDGELGEAGEDYPNGTMYQSNFYGQFTQPEKVNDYTYSMQIQEINYEEESGTEEIKDGVLYCYGKPYGLDGAEDILIYLPGAPLAELPEEFRSWMGYYDLSATEDTELPFYALYNEAEQCGFSSYNITDNIKEMIATTEESAALLENSIKNDNLTQTEYNEKTQQLYEVWDMALNTIWSSLKQTLEEEAMESLLAEQREWIDTKERAVAEAGAEYEGGSMQPMVMNQKAAEMTKSRVYELLELLE